MTGDTTADRIYAGMRALYELDQIANLRQAIDTAEWINEALAVANSGKEME